MKEKIRVKSKLTECNKMSTGRMSQKINFLIKIKYKTFKVRLGAVLSQNLFKLWLAFDNGKQNIIIFLLQKGVVENEDFAQSTKKRLNKVQDRKDRNKVSDSTNFFKHVYNYN